LAPERWRKCAFGDARIFGDFGHQGNLSEFGSDSIGLTGQKRTVLRENGPKMGNFSGINVLGLNIFF
jgi:hypothetical protein